jgi:hypothetical protein
VQVTADIRQRDIHNGGIQESDPGTQRGLLGAICVMIGRVAELLSLAFSRRSRGLDVRLKVGLGLALRR